jgi:hypothetical protein
MNILVNFSTSFESLALVQFASSPAETASVKITDDDSVVSLASLDIPAAFNTICYKTTLQRLENEFGIVGVALHWFQSYLSDRT